MAADSEGALVRLMSSSPDGDYQTWRANDGAFIRVRRDKEFGSAWCRSSRRRTDVRDGPFFPTIKIFNPHEQNYQSVDADLMLGHKEPRDGHILYLGIHEARSVAAFTAAGSVWAAADQMARAS